MSDIDKKKYQDIKIEPCLDEEQEKEMARTLNSPLSESERKDCTKCDADVGVAWCSGLLPNNPKAVPSKE